MSIKFDSGANPSKVIWKSSPSATEQEVFNIKMGTNSVWAKPYTLVSYPRVGALSYKSATGVSFTRLSGRTDTSFNSSSFDVDRDSFFYHSSQQDSSHQGYSAGITFSCNEGSNTSAAVYLYKPSYSLDSYDKLEVIYTDNNKTASIIATVTLNDEIRRENIFTVSSMHEVILPKITSLWSLYTFSYDETETSENNGKTTYGLGITVGIKGTLQTNMVGDIRGPGAGTYWFNVLFDRNTRGYNSASDYKITTLEFPLRVGEGLAGWSSSMIAFAPEGSTSAYVLQAGVYSAYADYASLEYGADEFVHCTMKFNFSGYYYTYNSSSNLNRVSSLEPTASKGAISSTPTTVYWGDYLELVSNGQALNSWTITNYFADSAGRISFGGSYLSLSDWEEVYSSESSWDIAVGYPSYSKVFATEKYYSSSNHKTPTSTTNQFFALKPYFNYAPLSGWHQVDLRVEQEQALRKKTSTLNYKKSSPSSVTAPSITVTDMGYDYVNIKVVNNSSYAGSYSLNFKVYHQAGDPETREASGAISANGTSIPTIRVNSSRGGVKGVAGTGQVYYLGKGSSATSFSRGDTGGNSGGGNVCLIKNTPILMADYTEKPIQDIVVGDEILGYDFENNCTTPTVVMYSIPTKFQQQAHYIIFDNGKTLCTTRGHELYVVEYGRYVPVEDIKEGEHCLDENDNETEVLVVHYDVELKTFEQFYHIVSSNNTYYANGILNAGVPIDKYRYIHDLRGENISEPIEALIMDESKDTACFNFTVTNQEFLQKGIPFQSNIKKSHNRIAELEKLIVKLDEAIAKVAAGLGLDDEYEKLKAKYYKEIAELQEKIVNWEEDYNKLLAQYSEIGEDILLDDKERRKKYFRRANKIANDNFEVYKANYVRDPAPKDLGEGVEFIRAEDDYLK